MIGHAGGASKQFAPFCYIIMSLIMKYDEHHDDDDDDSVDDDDDVMVK